MKYFLDTEFIEYPHVILLISIGIVAEDGREYYAESSEWDNQDLNQTNDCGEWLQKNVICHLDKDISKRKSLLTIKTEVLEFIGEDKPIFYGYYADYDWVVFCWIFGQMVDLPRDWPKYCRDIKQLADMLGNPTLPKQESNEHNALADARWNKQAFEFLKNYVSHHFDHTYVDFLIKFLD